MADAMNRQHPRANRILAALPGAVYERLVPSLEAVSMTLKQIQYQPDGAIPHVYFPLNTVTSLVIRWQRWATNRLHSTEEPSKPGSGCVRMLCHHQTRVRPPAARSQPARSCIIPATSRAPGTTHRGNDKLSSILLGKNHHCLGCVAFDDLFGNGIGTANFAKQAGATARGAHLRLRIKLNQAQMGSPAVVPLEIIN